MGRLGHQSATPTLVELLSDADTLVRANAAFALGLLADSSALIPLRDFVLNAPGSDARAAEAEAVSAIARIGGPPASQVIADLLARWSGQASNPSAALLEALGGAWRLGDDAPVSALVPFASAPAAEARRRAVYSLARIHAGEAADVLLAATDDSLPDIRATAVRELTVSYADAAGLDRSGLAGRVRRLTGDPDPGVRISALRALGTYGTEDLAGAAVERMADADPGVRLQALTALGQLKGALAIETLAEWVGPGPYAIRRQALLSLARAGSSRALTKIRPWLTDPDWRYRTAAAEAAGLVGGDSAVAWFGAAHPRPRRSSRRRGLECFG